MMMNGDDGSTSTNLIWDDEASFNAMFSGVNLQSFLAGANQTYHPFFGGGYVSDALGFPNNTPPPPLYPPASSNFVAETTDSSDSTFFIIPKSEPMNVYEESPFVFHDLTPFPHLPDLRSFEHCSSSSSINKRARVDSKLNPLTESSFQDFLVPYGQYKPSPSPDLTGGSVQIPRSALARQRRQKLSDKTRCLQKLLPWDKKMDIATMLEEAFKYVKFLQAQLLALKSMPCESAIISTNSNRSYISGGFGGLERLNRNQLLQVLVNSPVAQTMLCSRSCCVLSAEQLGIIQKIAEKRILQQQISTFYHKQP